MGVLHDLFSSCFFSSWGFCLYLLFVRFVLQGFGVVQRPSPFFFLYPIKTSSNAQKYINYEYGYVLRL
eukprot:m.83200 g.83200  ORF g.83200 m.83200 type:complete len:68 (-) comp12907_c0_seq1:25-228(-)